jgi:Domain of unknown function (DUF4190)
MSNDYPPPPGSGQDPDGQSGQPPPPPGPQWNPQSGGTPPESSGGDPAYGQPGYGQPGYGQGQQPYGQPPGYPPGPGAPGGHGQPKKSPLAVTALVTGVIGAIPCCWSLPIFAVVALVTGVLGRKQIDESQGQLTGRGMATAGVILGIVVLVIAVVYWILYAAGVFDELINYNFETS